MELLSCRSRSKRTHCERTHQGYTMDQNENQNEHNRSTYERTSRAVLPPEPRHRAPSSLTHHPPSHPPAAAAGVASDCDVLVVGGGINGAGIARDLAGRGLSVLLCEKDDLASHTSSSSTKLIHGGLRYLEYYEFSLVRKALAEREVLLRSAPHIMWPLRFVMPHDPGMRPVWMIRAGLFLYDHLARREVLPGSATVDLRRHAAARRCKPASRKGFVYSDGWVDDARLVVLNAIDAAERGATVLTRCACVDAQPRRAAWRLRRCNDAAARRSAGARRARWSTPPARGRRSSCAEHGARAAAQGAAPGQGQPHRGAQAVRPRPRLHLPEPRQAHHLRHPLRGRLHADRHHRCRAPRRHRRGAHRRRARSPTCASRRAATSSAPVLPSDVVWSYSGVRPLLDDESGDPSAVTRDYRSSSTPTVRRRRCCRCGAARSPPSASSPKKPPTCCARRAGRTARAAPGPRRVPARRRPRRLDRARRSARTPTSCVSRRRGAAPSRGLPARRCQRLARGYGSRVGDAARAAARLGAEVAPGLFEAELNYLHAHEWARRRRRAVAAHQARPALQPQAAGRRC